MFDDFLRDIRKFQRNIERVAGEQSVTFGELFSDEFMLRHTDFPSVGAMFDQSPFKLETNEDLALISEADLDAFVEASSRFATWEEMKSAAAGEWASRRVHEG